MEVVAHRDTLLDVVTNVRAVLDTLHMSTLQQPECWQVCSFVSVAIVFLPTHFVFVLYLSTMLLLPLVC